VAEAAVMEDTLSARQKGEEHCQPFIEERLQTTARSVFDRVPQLKLRIFREQKKDHKQQKLIAAKANCSLITRIPQ
jgi:hypothetical protein